LGYGRTGKVSYDNQRLLSKYSFLDQGSQVVLIVYDLTDPASFKEIEDYWIQEAKNNSDTDIMICLVGNKCDMARQV
jgi:GTPase SAR1 family protein